MKIEILVKEFEEKERGYNEKIGELKYRLKDAFKCICAADEEIRGLKDMVKDLRQLIKQGE